MAVINRPLKDLNMASILRKIADGKLPVDGLRYRLPTCNRRLFSEKELL